MVMPKPKAVKARKAVKPIKVSPLNDIVVAAMFTDVKSAGLAAEYLVKDVLGEYGKRLGKVISVRTQDYHKLANFRGTRVDVVCRTDNPDWLQPAHITYDKEPRRIAYDKLEIFNIQFPVFMKNEPDFDRDGECWLYVMHKAHTLEITPQEVIEMEPRLSRFATMNPGFEQYQIQLHRALADPDVMEELRMAAKARISEAGMLKAEWEKGMQEGEKRGRKKGKAEGHKEVAARMLKRGRPLDEIAADTGLSLNAVRTIQKDLE
jgi:hypothetical protein